MCTHVILKSKKHVKIYMYKVQTKFVLDKLLLNKMGEFHVTIPENPVFVPNPPLTLNFFYDIFQNQKWSFDSGT